MKEKDIEWHGSSFDDLKKFPASAMRAAGHQIRKVQRYFEPSKWKPIKTVGAGAIEIIVDENDGFFRVIYVAKFKDVVHVLHCFQKKSNKTSKGDIALAKKRYKKIGG